MLLINFKKKVIIFKFKKFKKVIIFKKYFLVSFLFLFNISSLRLNNLTNYILSTKSNTSYLHYIILEEEKEKKKSTVLLI